MTETKIVTSKFGTEIALLIDRPGLGQGSASQECAYNPDNLSFDPIDPFL